MAIFKKKKEETNAPAVEKTVEKKATAITKDYSWVLRSPRITEKAALSAEGGTYVFNIDVRANKYDVKNAITEMYKVTPEKVRIAKVPSKAVTRRKRSGTVTGKKAGGKKAYIYLKKGDKIEFA